MGVVEMGLWKCIVVREREGKRGAELRCFAGKGLGARYAGGAIEAFTDVDLGLKRK